jgi:ABC-type glycerol-3-phosphate transport system permease component
MIKGGNKVEAIEYGQTIAVGKRGQPWYRRRGIRRAAYLILVYALIIPGAIVLMLPLLTVLSTALKEPKQIFAFPPEWIPNPFRWQNFSEAWTGYVDFNLYMRNSFMVTISNIIGNLVSCSLAAYGFARLRARGKEVLFLLVLGTMMVPLWVTLIPQYVLFSKLDWTNSFLPLMVPPWFGWPFFIFLLRQFFMTIPKDLDDAARIDGCSTWGILWHIILPLSKPALAAVAVFAFVGNWTNFLGPLVYLQDENLYTLPLALQHFQGEWGDFARFYHLIMAVTVITMLPIVVIFLLMQRYFVKGIVMSGVKR